MAGYSFYSEDFPVGEEGIQFGTDPSIAIPRNFVGGGVGGGGFENILSQLGGSVLKGALGAVPGAIQANMRRRGMGGMEPSERQRMAGTGMGEYIKDKEKNGGQFTDALTAALVKSFGSIGDGTATTIGASAFRPPSRGFSIV